MKVFSPSELDLHDDDARPRGDFARREAELDGQVDDGDDASTQVDDPAYPGRRRRDARHGAVLDDLPDLEDPDRIFLARQAGSSGTAVGDFSRRVHDLLPAGSEADVVLFVALGRRGPPVAPGSCAARAEPPLRPGRATDDPGRVGRRERAGRPPGDGNKRPAP